MCHPERLKKIEDFRKESKDDRAGRLLQNMVLYNGPVFCYVPTSFMMASPNSRAASFAWGRVFPAAPTSTSRA